MATPAYRDLGPDDAPGADIAQLNRNLIKLGFNPDGIVADDEWQPATSDGVEVLQESLDEPPTGTLTLGQVVFLPGPQLVSSVDATVGGTGGGSGVRVERRWIGRLLGLGGLLGGGPRRQWPPDRGARQPAAGRRRALHEHEHQHDCERHDQGHRPRRRRRARRRPRQRPRRRRRTSSQSATTKGPSPSTSTGPEAAGLVREHRAQAPELVHERRLQAARARAGARPRAIAPEHGDRPAQLRDRPAARPTAREPCRRPPVELEPRQPFE